MKDIEKNIKVIEAIVDTLIESEGLDKNFKDDLMSEAKIAFLECRKKHNINACITKKLIQYIRKERMQKEELPSLLKAIKENGDNFELFLKIFRTLPKEMQAKGIEATIKNSNNVDLDSLKEIFIKLLSELETENPEMAEEVAIKLNQIVDEKEKIRKTKTKQRCKKTYN